MQRRAVLSFGWSGWLNREYKIIHYWSTYKIKEPSINVLSVIVGVCFDRKPIELLYQTLGLLLFFLLLERGLTGYFLPLLLLLLFLDSFVLQLQSTGILLRIVLLHLGNLLDHDIFGEVKHRVNVEVLILVD